MAVKAGADALGLVSAMPSGPGVISEREIAEITATVPSTVATFLLTSETDPGRIVEQHRICQTSTIQLVDSVDVDAYKALRSVLPGIKLVQVVHVLDEKAITEAGHFEPYADALLLDSGNPNLQIKELGGTGRKHNWEISRQIVENVSIPVFLAGGLCPENVRAAIDLVQPFGVDICSGIRTDGVLDAHKLQQYITVVANQ